ncbi:hypothetical protein BC628DRAFT_8410 [Trametes gibbosa]|nr:hypothetical protein BC628DRAFT_8410 [Trametes gibbosa]
MGCGVQSGALLQVTRIDNRWVLVPDDGEDLQARLRQPQVHLMVRRGRNGATDAHRSLCPPSIWRTSYGSHGLDISFVFPLRRRGRRPTPGTRLEPKLAPRVHPPPVCPSIIMNHNADDDTPLSLRGGYLRGPHGALPCLARPHQPALRGTPAANTNRSSSLLGWCHHHHQHHHHQLRRRALDLDLEHSPRGHWPMPCAYVHMFVLPACVRGTACTGARR